MEISSGNLNVVLVQSPAPVKNIKVKPSATSALVTWSIVTTKENSSYITGYDIYLHQNFVKTIARKDHGTQLNITGLKPCSDYIVGIMALDDSSQKSAVRYSEHFRIIDEGKHNAFLTTILLF